MNTNPLKLTDTEIRQLLIRANCHLVEGNVREYLVQITELAVLEKLRQGGAPVAWRSRHRSEPGMIGHYPWHYVERAPQPYTLTHYEHEPLYSVPPASTESQRMLFPTHLRKMWSGGEVQAWLDEQLGVTVSTPSAKGSLERYRQWQAGQSAHAPQSAEACSCPSGDGSLRPCAVHAQPADGVDWRQVAIEAQAERDAAREERDAALAAKEKNDA